jgi:hypothetical protein
VEPQIIVHQPNPLTIADDQATDNLLSPPI